uniref:Uncharacterized protein n=1 Tax=Palpitomonas bilix TaxID=652834 RepID=A0A7S3GFH5_9EUKA
MGQHKYGKRTTAAEVCEGHDLTGKVIIVTGANTGIGKETARVLAKAGAEVVMGCRNEERAEGAIKDITAEIPSAKVTNIRLDLGDLKSVKAFADEFLSKYERLDILINNAGVMSCPKMVTKDGFDMQFGTNHLGHFYLTQLLRDMLVKSAPSRVVVLSSEAHAMLAAKFGMNFDDLQNEKGYTPWNAYGRSKLANLLFARELDRQMKEQGAKVTVNALHPGVIKTDLIRHLNPLMRFGFKMAVAFSGKNVPQGAATTVYAAVAEELEGNGGNYLDNCRIGKSSKAGRNMDAAKRLWEMSEKIIAEKTSAF